MDIGETSPTAQVEVKALIGNSLRSVEKRDYSWFFVFSDEFTVVTEAPWRFITHDGIYVTSEDHGHQFGLPEPVDAAHRVMIRAATQVVTAALINPLTGDLTFHLGEQTRLEFLQMSCGYEAWRLYHGGTETICTGGGAIAYFQKPNAT
jgi:hypothetical protein